MDDDSFECETFINGEPEFDSRGISVVVDGELKTCEGVFDNKGISIEEI